MCKSPLVIPRGILLTVLDGFYMPRGPKSSKLPQEYDHF